MQSEKYTNQDFYILTVEYLPPANFIQTWSQNKKGLYSEF